jgi:hypothetical protein
MPNGPALFFQGTASLQAGSGVVFGDGLLCARGSIIRLGVKLNSGGASQYPLGPDALISVRGMNSPGNVRSYQVWYRNSVPFCQQETFNLTNALEVTWLP